jgi:hypothetical protein
VGRQDPDRAGNQQEVTQVVLVLVLLFMQLLLQVQRFVRLQAMLLLVHTLEAAALANFK